MKMTIFSGILLLFIAVPCAPKTAPAQKWTWVHGQLESDSQQKKYMKSLQRTFGWYQKRGIMKGELVAETALEARPEGRVVFIGPIAAFRHPEWFGLPLDLRVTGRITIGGVSLHKSRTGIYLRSDDRTRILFTGLSLRGYGNIFTVPTGGQDCTVTRARGKVSHVGSYADGKLVLTRLPFLSRYPLPGDMKGPAIPEQAIIARPVVTGPEPAGLVPEFKEWLAAFTKKQKVLFVGESHWNASVNRLFKLIIQELLASGRLRSVFLEVNYSFSGFFDHHVREADDEKAARFLKDALHPLVASRSTLELLEILRRWNATHPGHQVRVGCLDMEWGYGRTTWRFIKGFLRRVDPEFTLPDPYFIKNTGGKQPRKKVLDLLAKARAKGIVGAYPFLTPDYIENAITNLWDTAAIKNFQRDRQRYIIRNITEFNGHLLEKGLIVFKGGGWHALKKRPEGEEYYRDAAYLDEVHPSTRGKVSTLLLRALGYRFGVVAGLDLKKRMASATNYNNYVHDFQEALAEGSASRDAHYLLNGEPGPFDTLMVGLGYRTGQDILRIAGVDWKQLIELHGNALKRRSRIQDHDAVIYVLRGNLEVMRPRNLEQK